MKIKGERQWVERRGLTKKESLERDSNLKEKGENLREFQLLPSLKELLKEFLIYVFIITHFTQKNNVSCRKMESSLKEFLLSY